MGSSQKTRWRLIPSPSMAELKLFNPQTRGFATYFEDRAKYEVDRAGLVKTINRLKTAEGISDKRVFEATSSFVKEFDDYYGIE